MGGAVFTPPPRWDADALRDDVERAKADFRRERFGEPLELYLELFDTCLGTIEDLLELTIDLSRLRESATQIVADTDLLRALRFVAGPFVSEDDLQVIAETTLAPGRLAKDPGATAAIIDGILVGLDRRRFPWVHEQRVPDRAEVAQAAVATATLMATEQHRTLRRTRAGRTQEDDVADALTAAGFTCVQRPREIRLLSQAPDAGEFCREVEFGGRKADLVVGLWDGRRMAVECKVSNSGTNSIKRVLNDTAAKATEWLRTLGASQVVPAAVLSGVFKPATLWDAQSLGLTLFWAHRLDDLVGWIDRTRP